MDVKKFKEIKRRHQLASQPEVQPLPKPELEARSELQTELVIQPPQSQELTDRTEPKPDTDSQFLPESGGYLESVATIEREESIGSSGWGYSQLLKEFRE